MNLARLVGGQAPGILWSSRPAPVLGLQLCASMLEFVVCLFVLNLVSRELKSGLQDKHITN